MQQQPYDYPFHLRYSREIKEVSVAVIALMIGLLYGFSADFQALLDRGVNPAVYGISKAYSSASTFIYRRTGTNLGLISIPADQDFLFAVRLATYINQRRAGPLLDIAADTRFPDDKRERAMLALLKFDNTADWIQPFLNELPKGGLLGMYEQETPTLDELVKQIRLEGGVRQPLVRAYAEVVFSFMLQHPDLVIRLHATKWVSDVVAEDSLFLLIPRFPKEHDAQAQKSIESALYGIRAISEPQTARELLLPFFHNPPWPSLKRPLGVVLGRLGYPGSYEYVAGQLNQKNLSDSEKVALSMAMEHTPYPKELTASSEQRMVAMAREQQRQDELKAALARRESLLQETRAKLGIANESDAAKATKAAQEAAEAEAALAAANAKKAADEEAALAAENAKQAAQAEASAAAERKAAEAKEAALAEKKAAAEKAHIEATRKAAEREAAAVQARKEAEAKAAAAKKESDAKAAAAAAKKAAEVEAQAVAARQAAQAAEATRVAKQAEEAKAAAAAAKKAAAAEAAAVAARKTAEEKSAAAAAKAASEAAKNVAPAPIPPIGVLHTEAPTNEGPGLPPPLEVGAQKSKSLMNYVDLVVQVKQEAAPLFQNPGDTPTGSALPASTKGHADFEAMIGDEKWYQVKSKKGTGWISGKYLSVFNLSPGSEAPVKAPAPATPSLEGGRQESTYFESGIENTPIFEKPDDNSKQVGTLTDSTPYLAIRSIKVNANRWFELRIRADATAWARGTDLQLADVQQPNIMEIPTQELSQRGKQSAFKAEWVSPAVKGVGVYSRPSIAAPMVKQVNPQQVFKVVDTQSTAGVEWYKIELSAKVSGWVQTMDVKLTKKPN